MGISLADPHSSLEPLLIFVADPHKRGGVFLPGVFFVHPVKRKWDFVPSLVSPDDELIKVTGDFRQSAPRLLRFLNRVLVFATVSPIAPVSLVAGYYIGVIDANNPHANGCA